jgi:hypothetical protein
VNSGGHLLPELAFGYEQGLLSADELREVHDHIASCSDCRKLLAERLDADTMVEDVRGALDAGRPGTRRWWPALAATAAVLVAVGGALRWARRAPAPVNVAEDDSDTPVVREALRSGRLPTPGFLGSLASPRETLMGAESKPGPPRFFAPAATAVLEPAPRFRWDALSGQWTYRVRVFRENGEPVAESPDLSVGEWNADRPFPAGENYAWQVAASRGAEKITLPQPPDTPPRFRVLDGATAARLRNLAGRRPGSLLLAVEYAQAGAVENARSELAAFLRLHPGREDVRALLRSLGPAGV